MKITITSMTRTISIKNYIKLFSVIGLFSFIFIYSLFQTRSIKNGVLLQVNNIENGIETTEEIFSIEGNAKHASQLLVNGREILIDKENNFKTEVLLSPGYNIVTIEAEDRFNKYTKQIFEVFLRESNEDLVFNNY